MSGEVFGGGFRYWWFGQYNGNVVTMSQRGNIEVPPMRAFIRQNLNRLIGCTRVAEFKTKVG